MAQTPTQARAAQAVAAWLAYNEKNPAWLVDATGADPGTIGDFLNGLRWPKLGTQGKIEKALGWPAGSIRQIGNGWRPEEVGAVTAPREADVIAEVIASNLSEDTRRLILQALREQRAAGRGESESSAQTG